jgi:hypothetical protein
VTLQDVDDDDDDDSCTLIVSLMQVGRRKLRKKLGANSNLTIGFAIYKVRVATIKTKLTLSPHAYIYWHWISKR